MMNSSCQVTADSTMIVTFFFIGGFLSIIGCLFNFYSCILFIRTKSLFNTPYAIFIIALSIVDIIKLIAEYHLHLLFIYIKHPYFVCSVTWFLTMISENSSYAFLCALGIERNIKVWTINRRWLITRSRACLITVLIIIIVIIYNHPFLYWPLQFSYCYFSLFDYSIIYTCTNARYQIYGYSFTLTNLLFIENLGLNNIILPLMIILTNIILIIGLKHRNAHRRNQFGTKKIEDAKEQSVILYMLLSSIIFVLLTSPIGILGIWGIISRKEIPTNNLSLIFDLMEIIHHGSHFPVLLLTSSMIRRKMFQRQKNLFGEHPIRRQHPIPPPVHEKQQFLIPHMISLITDP